MFARTFVTFLMVGACLQSVANDEGGRRVVLVEEFTNVACAPCAEFAVNIDKALDTRLNDVALITYHYNFPSPQDPFYIASKSDVDARAAFYGITGVPTVFFNGVMDSNYWNDFIGCIDRALQAKDRVDLDVKASNVARNLSAEVKITAKEDINSNDLRLFVVAVEELVNNGIVAPNGEKHWNYVMRRMLPSGEGLPVDGVLAAGESKTFACSGKVDNLFDEGQLGIITFVQDMSTHEVLGSVYTPRPTGSDDAAKILKVENYPDRICDPLFNSTIVLRNTGKNVLRSADINVSVNGFVHTEPWTGNVDYLMTDTVQTKDFTNFTLNQYPGSNDVSVWLSDINGSGEQSAKVQFTTKTAVNALEAVRLTIVTDYKPEEISWILYNSAGDIVEQGGSYDEARHRYEHVFALDVDDCYMLEFHDEGGDGITGANGNGYYKLDELRTDGSHKMLVQDDYREAVHTVNFSLQNANAGVAGISGTYSNEDNAVSVTDLSGKSLGTYDMQAPVTNGLAPGVYILGKKGENAKKVIIR